MTNASARRGRSAGRFLGRFLLALLAVVVLLLAVLWFGGRWYLSLSSPDQSGEHRVVGLDADVEITFDEMGIPQIWAETNADAHFALGWLHASDRLFQMETFRRMSLGTLSEVFGEMTFEVDVRQRQFGFHRLARAAAADLDSDTRGLLEAYVAGINHRIEARRVLPPEFVLLRHHPRPWTVEDVVTVFLYQSWYPTELGDQLGPNRRLVDALGEEAAELISRHRPWSIPTVHAGSFEALLESGLGTTMTLATNSWVVGPERSASGRALHAADPHLVVSTIPGFWYVVGMHAREGGSALGVTVPGVPTIAMGHNGEVAWSFSVAPLILVDHFAEEFHPQDSLRVRTPDGYADLDVVYEEIVVAGEEEAREVPVYRTPRGVIVERTGDSGTSLYWSGFDLFTADAVRASTEIPGAHDFESFRGIVRRLPHFSVNWMYSDRGGNIGYQLGPTIPDRSFDPVLGADASDPDAHHGRFHPPEMIPFALNPERGWLATTNNPPAPEDWPIDIPGNYNHLRMKRVATLMGEQQTFDRDDMRRMQLDITSQRALEWRDLIADAADRLERSELAESLRAWDGRMVTDDTCPTVFLLWWHHLTRHLFEDRLGPDWQAAGSLREIVLRENLTHYIDDTRTPEVETAVDIAARALADALDDAAGRTLREVQTLTIHHPLSQVRLLDRFLRLNRGPLPWAGDSESLNVSVSSFEREDRTFSTLVAPSMRYVLDWADVDGFTIELPMGQSGNPFSPHYDDFLELYERGERWVVPFSKSAVEARAASTLRLASE